MSAALKSTFGSLFCYPRQFILTNKADNILCYRHVSFFRLRCIVAVLLTSWQCLFCIFLNSLGFSKFVFVLTWLTCKNIFFSNAVKCDKLQIWPINHEVLQTWSDLSHLWCDADNTSNQGYLLDKDTRLNYWYSLQPDFFWDVLVICLILVLKSAITAFTSLYFRTLWSNWLNFLSFKK